MTCLSLAKNEQRLSAMTKLECEACSPDIQSFYDTSLGVVELNSKLVSMAMDSAQGSKMLGQGRVVVLRDDVSADCFE